MIEYAAKKIKKLKKTTFGRNFLHNLHGQFFGFHFFFQFKILKAFTFLMESGTISQILCFKKCSN